MGRTGETVVKIRYADLPEGLHVDVRSQRGTTIIYLAHALSRVQRRAAITKARQAARVGRSAPLPVGALRLALGADRVRGTLRAVTSVARVHPIGFAIPSVIVLVAVGCYTLVASVTGSHQSGPSYAARPVPGWLPAGIGSARVPAAPRPAGIVSIAVAGDRDGPLGRSRQATVGRPGTAPSPRPAPAGSASAPRPSAVPGPPPDPGPSGSGLCVRLDQAQVCLPTPLDL
jgi:hypothetical protein